MYNKGMKNTHLEHLEDEILNRGSAGAEDVISVLRSADDILTGKSNDLGITTKWDGAPAVVCGTCPQTGKFFVGTKSVFNKTTPKICYTEADIDQWYQGALASKLKTCLQYLPQLRIIGIVQGDLLFTDDVIPGVIGKNKVLTFTPNTITYTVPVGSEAAIQIMRQRWVLCSTPLTSVLLSRLLRLSLALLTSVVLRMCSLLVPSSMGM